MKVEPVRTDFDKRDGFALVAANQRRQWPRLHGTFIKKDAKARQKVT